MTAAELLKSIRSLVAYHKSCGVAHYRHSESLESGLRLLETIGAEGLSEKEGAPPSPAAEKFPAAPKGGSDTNSLAELTKEIRGCRLCGLHQTRKISTPGHGGDHPDLLVIGDWLTHTTNDGDGALFGEQQDLMLSRMIGAMQIQPSAVYVTNLIKCSVPDSTRPDADQIATCLGYVKQQISLLSPRVIVTMGSGASQALLDSSKPLIALRGRFHSVTVGGRGQIPLMATFHPSYLLKNPEMKQPTWNDLQAVKKKLSESP